MFFISDIGTSQPAKSPFFAAKAILYNCCIAQQVSRHQIIVLDDGDHTEFSPTKK
jgi:hypothetical protein